MDGPEQVNKLMQKDRPFERHVLRQMQQLEGEAIDQFVCRLRQKAIPCAFASVDESICDQIIKSRDQSLRHKFLEKSSGAALVVLQETARICEVVNNEMPSMDRPEQVNKLTQKNCQGNEKEKRENSAKEGNVIIVVKLVI